MTKFILSAMVASLTVAAAMAGPGGKGNGGGNHSTPSHSMSPKQSSFNWHSTSNNFKSTSNYHLNFGKSFSGGFCYQGKNHNHWTYSCFSSKFGCQCYWCPSTCSYYYWCEPSCCYYPISYVTYAPPVQVQVQVTAPVTIAQPAPYIAPIQTQVQTQTQTQTQVQGQGS